MQARYCEKENPLGIRYILGDASKNLNENIGTFDVCFAGLVLHYSRDKTMLKGFLQNIHNLLRKGGLLIALNRNLDDVKCQPELIQYGITTSLDRLPPGEEDAIHALRKWV